MNTRDHWQHIYQTRLATEVSWYAAHVQQSLRLIQEVAPPTARIIDVGAGASTLADDLLDIGYHDITLLDVSDTALSITHTRLGDRAMDVRWLATDVTSARFEQNCFDIWHDRAVFHFLATDVDRQAYLERVRCSVVRGGHVVMATFSLSGPAKCSGLDVVRYDPHSLSKALGRDFELATHLHTTHTTPAGRDQHFLFCVFKKLA